MYQSVNFVERRIKVKVAQAYLLPCVISVLLSGVNASTLHFEFILSVPISSLVKLCNKYISPNLPHNAINLPSGDTS